MTVFLNPKLWAAVAIAMTFAAFCAFVYRLGGMGPRAELAQYKLHVADLAEQQRLANRSRAAQSERAEGERIAYRDRVITKTITEVRHATVPLADCPLPAPAVRVLNDAARCTREGRSPTCFADAAVPDAE